MFKSAMWTLLAIIYAGMGLALLLGIRSDLYLVWIVKFFAAAGCLLGMMTALCAASGCWRQRGCRLGSRDNKQTNNG